MKKILVTGAGGFVGGHLVKELLNRGFEVRAVDIKKIEEWFQLSSNIENFSLDMSIKENCFKMVDGVEGVINMACNMGGMGFIENNKALCMLSVLVNTHMLLACKEFKIKKYFFSSSACAYNKDLQNDTSITGLKEADAYPANPEDGYGWEKLFSERMCRHFTEDFGLPTRVIRYHNVYGPRMGFKHVIPQVTQRYLDHEAPFKIFGFDQTRSFNYIDDAVMGTVLAMESDNTNGEIFHIGNMREEIKIEELVRFIGEQLGYNGEYSKVGAPSGSVNRRCPDTTKAEQMLNYQPQISWREGVQRTVDWYVEYLKEGKNVFE